MCNDITGLRRPAIRPETVRDPGGSPPPVKNAFAGRTDDHLIHIDEAVGRVRGPNGAGVPNW